MSVENKFQRGLQFYKAIRQNSPGKGSSPVFLLDPPIGLLLYSAGVEEFLINPAVRFTPGPGNLKLV